MAHYQTASPGQPFLPSPAVAHCPTAPPGQLSKCQQLFSEITEATIPVSQNACSGRGSHGTYFYGSPPAELAAALHVKALVLTWLQGQAALPRTATEFQQLLTALLGFLGGLSLTLTAPFQNTQDEGLLPSVRAPTFLGMTAMRRLLTTITQKYLLEMKLQQTEGAY